MQLELHQCSIAPERMEVIEVVAYSLQQHYSPVVVYGDKLRRLLLALDLITYTEYAILRGLQ